MFEKEQGRSLASEDVALEWELYVSLYQGSYEGWFGRIFDDGFIYLSCDGEIFKQQQAWLFNQKMMYCPCLKYKDCNKKILTTIREHFILNSRHPNFRIWKGPRNRNSLEEEWEEEF